MAHSSRSYPGCKPVDPGMLMEKFEICLSARPISGTPQELSEGDLRRAISEFRDGYLLRECLRKYPLEGNVDTRTTALRTMFEREGKNKEANDRISARDYGDDPRVREVYNLACRKAVMTLGRFDPQMFREGLRFGPGSTTRLKSNQCSVDDKLAGPSSVTAKARDLGYLVLTESPLWAFNIGKEICPDTVLVIEDNEKVTTVPKNAATDRVIAIQPDMNIYCQLAVGYCLRHALSRVGVNLNDQTINQRRALEGSLEGKLATVDLSSASDSIVWQLVWDFIGNWSDLDGSVDRTWWRVMDTLRCETGMVDGEIFVWERFSAMGNGYTFELESLIFWALTVSTCEVLGVPPDVSVYGDDIICPVEVIPLLEQVFSFCGLDFNMKKTHMDTGPMAFRESCGKHYMGGTDVTPFYVDAVLDNDAEILLLANNIVRWAVFPGGYGRDKRLQPLWEWVVSHLSSKARKSAIPLGEDDDGLIMDFDEASPRVKYVTGPLHFVHYKDEGVWTLNDSDSTLSLARSVTRTEKLRCAPMRIGYQCNTFGKVFGGRPLKDDEAYLVWHYHKSFRRFSWGPDDDQAPWLKNLKRDAYIRYRGSSPQYRYKEGRRYVTVWKTCGPWL